MSLVKRYSLLLNRSKNHQTDDFQSLIMKLCIFKQGALSYNIHNSGALLDWLSIKELPDNLTLSNVRYFLIRLIA